MVFVEKCLMILLIGLILLMWIVVGVLLELLLCK